MKVISVDDVDYEVFVDFESIMVLGAVDRGKSTFIKNLTNFFVKKGFLVNVVDLDVGQSDIGHPGLVAYGFVDREISLLSDIVPKYFHFYGYVSPQVDPFGYIFSLRKLVKRLKGEKRTDKTLIDTTGWISGYIAFSLKLLKIELFRPELVVLIGEEVFNWYHYVRKLVKEVFLFYPSRYVVNKDRERREKNRLAITLRYFHEKPMVRLKKDLLLTLGRYQDLSEGRIIGFFDHNFETLATGWIIRDLGEEVILNIYRQFSGKVSFVKVGDKIGQTTQTVSQDTNNLT